MNFFKFAAISMAIGSFLAAQADERLPDFDWLSTGFGETYHEVVVVSADQFGMTLRHREGIAKLDWKWLAPQLQDQYGPVPPPDDLIEEAPSGGFDVATEPKEAAEYPSPMLTLRTRVTLPVRKLSPIGHLDGVYTSCGRLFPIWKPWWPRYQAVHGLVHPFVRHIALEDLIRTSGYHYPTVQGVYFGKPFRSF